MMSPPAVRVSVAILASSLSSQDTPSWLQNSSREDPATRADDSTGIWLSPCSPMTYACTFAAATPQRSASRRRKRDVSREVPEPITRLEGSPDHFHAAYVMASTGFDA